MANSGQLNGAQMNHNRGLYGTCGGVRSLRAVQDGSVLEWTAMIKQQYPVTESPYAG